ncbi:eukaryotic translation initiation factor 3 subunit A, partial [Ascosphaera acerosa]
MPAEPHDRTRRVRHVHHRALDLAAELVVHGEAEEGLQAVEGGAHGGDGEQAQGLEGAGVGVDGEGGRVLAVHVVHDGREGEEGEDGRARGGAGELRVLVVVVGGGGGVSQSRARGLVGGVDGPREQHGVDEREDQPLDGAAVDAQPAVRDRAGGEAGVAILLPRARPGRRLRAAQQLEAERQRLAEELRERELKRVREEQERIKQAEIKKQLEELKTLPGKGKGLDISDIPLEELDSARLRLMKLQQLEREKNELNDKVRITGKRIDHLERAYRREEINHLPADYEAQKKRDRELYERVTAEFRAAHRLKHKEDVALKKRLERLVPVFTDFRKGIAEKRHEEFERRRKAAEREFEAKKRQRIKEVKERLRAERLAREAEEQARREEEERLAREEEERAAREAERRQQLAEEKARREEERRYPSTRR